MSENGPSPSPAESRAERAEKAAIRRRWITLAELVGVAALIISATTLWLNWSGRREDEAARAGAAAEHALVTFSASRTSGGAVLALTDPDHRIQQIDIAFPPALEAQTREGLGTLAIQAKWFDRELLKATDGGPDKRSGRLPVLIAATWWDGDRKMVDRAIYQINWRTAGRLFRGRTVDLTGASLYERGGSPARLNVLWQKEKPAS